MQRAKIDHGRRAAVRIDGHQDVINFDLCEGLDRNAMTQGEHCAQIVTSEEGSFVILDDTPQRYSDTRALSLDSDAYLEGCLRVLQSIVGGVQRKDI